MTSAASADAEAALGRRIVRSERVAGGCITDARKVELEDGTLLFLKLDPAPPPSFFAAEAAGLRWLRASGTAAVPDVVAQGERFLALEWVEPGPRHASSHAAVEERLGRALAEMHHAGAAHFGRPPDAPATSYLGSLPVPDDQRPSWGQFWIEGRVRPLTRQAVDARILPSSALDAVDRLAVRIDEVAGPPEPAARVHGDLWWGNVHVDIAGVPWFVDPSAHGGHRETDHAMLSLFGGADVERVRAAYEEVSPLAHGWRERVALHQIVPLLAHVVLFGAAYVPSARAAFSAYIPDPW
jgi:fructosamine-3-kinase